jgi:hypothetical protein
MRQAAGIKLLMASMNREGAVCPLHRDDLISVLAVMDMVDRLDQMPEAEFSAFGRHHQLRGLCKGLPCPV